MRTTVICFRNTSPETEQQKREVSFQVKKALGLRKGWKIMADDGEIINNAALKTVVTMIKDMECQVSNNILLLFFQINHSGMCST